MYKSPLHILSDLEANPSELSQPGFLLRLRKKLLAEFNLSDSATIDINGKPYSKDEVIKTIDVLMGNPQMPLHSFVFSNKNLLDFLENDNSQVRPYDIKWIAVPEEIKPMLSPLLLERIIFNLKKAFHTRNFDKATDLLVYTPELQEEEKALLNEETNKNILNLQEHIQSVRANGCQNITKELDYLRKNSLTVLLNHLPVDFFDTINSLVGEIINTMVAYQQKVKSHDRAYLYYVSLTLCKIKCDEDLMKLVKSNHTVFEQNYERKTGSTQSSSSEGGDFFSGKTISFIIFVIIFVVRLATCSRHTSTNSNFDANQFRTPNTNFRMQRAESEEFQRYRKIRTSAGVRNYNNPADVITLDSANSGKNPFAYILQGNSYDDYADTSLRRVLIDNKSGYQLIITTFNRTKAKAYYFFENKTDTFSFRKDDQLCLYFGDSLTSLKAPNHDVSGPLTVFYELYFLHTSEKSMAILENNYTVTLTKASLKSQKKKRKNQLPVITFDKDFFDKQEFENSKVKLLKTTHDLETATGEEQMLEEITVSPQGDK